MAGIVEEDIRLVVSPVESPILSRPVLLTGYGKVRGVGGEPNGHRAVGLRFDEMGIGEHFPCIPVLLVVGFVLAEVFLQEARLVEPGDGIVAEARCSHAVGTLCLEPHHIAD